MTWSEWVAEWFLGESLKTIRSRAYMDGRTEGLKDGDARARRTSYDQGVQDGMYIGRRDTICRAAASLRNHATQRHRHDITVSTAVEILEGLKDG